MKRQIIFRGKRLDNGEWVYGDLLHMAGGCLIYFGDDTDTTSPDIERNCPIAVEFFKDEIAVVSSKTVGQFTGLLDRNGTEIYEGDIIHLNDEEFELEHGNGIVVFLDRDCGGRPCGGLWYVEDADEDSNTNTSLYDLWQCGEIEIIGNRFDNPDLLNGK